MSRLTGLALMSRLAGLALGTWEFVVGDEWRTAVGVVLAIALRPCSPRPRSRRGG